MIDFTVTEALEVYPVANRVDKHFKDHHYLTEEDYEEIKIEEYQKRIRQDLLKIEGESDVVLIDTMDLS